MDLLTGITVPGGRCSSPAVFFAIPSWSKVELCRISYISSVSLSAHFPSTLDKLQPIVNVRTGKLNMEIEIKKWKYK